MTIITIFMEFTAQKGKGDREKRTSDCARTRTYAIPRSFSHASHRDRSKSFVPHRSYVPVTGVPLSSDIKDLQLEAGTVCYVMVAGSAVPSTLHEFVSLIWKAASIYLCMCNEYL